MKTKIFTQENYSNDCSLKSSKLDKAGNPEKLFTDGTVLIPDSLHKHYQEQVDAIGTGEYLNSLLKKYSPFLKIDNDDVASKLNTDYQELNLGLHKENVHVEYKTWAELKMWKSL